jgi:hypothetical protein
MTASKSKNDKAWEIIFEEDKILDLIARQGFFQISSTRINQQREARLMTKFDHAVQLPQIFSENDLTIQPISRGNYIIGAFESYFQLPKKSSEDVVYRELPPHIKTLEPSNIYSESSAIICAFLSGMIDDVLGETTNFTILGRMSTGTFKYYIQNTVTYVLSDLGQFIISQHPRKKNLELVRCILRHRIFNLSLRIFFDKAQAPTKEEIVSIMKNGTEKISIGSDSTRMRRASTVERWLEWIIELPMTTP